MKSASSTVVTDVEGEVSYLQTVETTVTWLTRAADLTGSTAAISGGAAGCDGSLS